jgi:hypothetical protein
MFKSTGGRVPRFRQIVVTEAGALYALAGDAGGDTGSVWMYVTASTQSDEGWVKLSRTEVEDVPAKDS